MNNDIRRIVEENWEDIKALVIEKAEAEQKPKTIWDLDAVNGEEEYYYITEDGEIKTTYFDSLYDEKVRNLGNAFLTKVEAVVELERRKIEAIMRKYSRPFKPEEDNWIIEYYYDTDCISVSIYIAINDGVSCFESKEIAEKVIDEIGSDRLKKYWFEVTE